MSMKFQPKPMWKMLLKATDSTRNCLRFQTQALKSWDINKMYKEIKVLKRCPELERHITCHMQNTENPPCILCQYVIHNVKLVYIYIYIAINICV